MPRVAFEVPGVGYISSSDCRTGMRPGWDPEEDIRWMGPEHLDRERELGLDAFDAKIFVRLDGWRIEVAAESEESKELPLDWSFSEVLEE